MTREDSFHSPSDESGLPATRGRRIRLSGLVSFLALLLAAYCLLYALLAASVMIGNLFRIFDKSFFILCCAAIAVLLGIGTRIMRMGLRRVRRLGQSRKLIVSALATALLTFLLIPWLLITGFFWCDMMLSNMRIKREVYSAVSPDGHWRAFVLNKGFLVTDEMREWYPPERYPGGFDFRLMLEVVGSGKPFEIARLNAGDQVGSIDWSPTSDVVVFMNANELVALRLADMKVAVEPPRGRAEARVPAGWNMFDRSQFSPEGMFQYRLRGSDTWRSVPPESFKNRPAGFLVDQGNSDQ